MALLHLLFNVILAANAAAQINAPPTKVDARTTADLLAAACDGSVEEGFCNTDPVSGGKSMWSLGAVHTGHFISSKSTDAFVTVQLSPGFSPRRYSTMGLLLTRESGQWKMVDGPVIALNFNDCKQLRFGGGRDFLVCSSPDGDPSGQRTQIHMVFAEKEGIKLKLLFEGRDNTMICDPGTPIEKAIVHRIEFVDFNGDRAPDMSILASYGKTDRTQRLQERCEAADRQQKGARYPEPALKRYKVDLLFLNDEFAPTPASRQIMKFFEGAPE
jgi:hypothetical protein